MSGSLRLIREFQAVTSNVSIGGYLERTVLQPEHPTLKDPTFEVQHQYRSIIPLGTLVSDPIETESGFVNKKKVIKKVRYSLFCSKGIKIMFIY